MKTSSKETESIEHYLWGQYSLEEKLLFDVTMILDKELEEKTKWQAKAYQAIKENGRKNIRAEIISVEKILFTHPVYKEFRKKIGQIFNK